MPAAKFWLKEVRITPYDGNSLLPEWLEALTGMFTKFVLFEEGGEGTAKNLHYHGVFETSASEKDWRRQLMRIARRPADVDINGNRLYFTRDLHDKSHQYVAKCQKLVFCKGFESAEVTEWMKAAEEYRKEHERDRKREQRERQEELQFVYDIVKKRIDEKHLHPTWSLYPESVNRVLQTYMSVAEVIVDEFLRVCNENRVRFPSKSQMDSYVLSLAYQYDSALVVAYYAKSFRV